MKKISLVLLTKDINYANYFLNFMISSNIKEKFSSKIFTDVDSFKKNTRNKKQHILLTDLDVDNKFVVSFDRMISLSEEQITDSDETAIYKYQPFHELLSQVLVVYYEMNGKLGSVMSGKEKGKVISFFSGNGGVGKTVLSLCLAKHQAMNDNRVFYLSLEELHTTYLYFKQDKDKPSSAEVFYYLKKNKEQLIANIESLKSRDPLTNIDYFSFPVLPEEMQIATEEDIESLIQAIRDTQNYDYIIVDLDSSIHKRNHAALKNSDEIFWLLSSNETSFSSSQNVLENDLVGIGNDQSNVHFILNNVGNKLFEGFDSFNFRIETHIPYNLHWLSKSEESKLQEDTVIGEQLFKLLKENAVPSPEVSLQWQ